MRAQTSGKTVNKRLVSGAQKRVYQPHATISMMIAGSNTDPDRKEVLQKVTDALTKLAMEHPWKDTYVEYKFGVPHEVKKSVCCFKHQKLSWWDSVWLADGLIEIHSGQFHAFEKWVADIRSRIATMKIDGLFHARVTGSVQFSRSFIYEQEIEHPT